jgi:hypothetical protein
LRLESTIEPGKNAILAAILGDKWLDSVQPLHHLLDVIKCFFEIQQTTAEEEIWKLSPSAASTDGIVPYTSIIPGAFTCDSFYRLETIFGIYPQPCGFQDITRHHTAHSDS